MGDGEKRKKLSCKEKDSQYVNQGSTQESCDTDRESEYTRDAERLLKAGRHSRSKEGRKEK